MPLGSRRLWAPLLALAVLLVWWWHAPAPIDVRGRVVVVADLHGDLEHALAVLRMTGVVAADSTRWAGGSDVLVSTGDLVDRGDDTLALYRLFASLRKESAQAGGEVHNLVGNHEMMNAMMDWRYVTPGDIASFGGPEARRHAMSSAGWVGQEWLAHYRTTAQLPLLPTGHLPPGYRPPSIALTHGGITPYYAGLGIAATNEIGASLLHKALAEEEPDGYLPRNATRAEALLYSENGPLWYRGYALLDEADACATAAKTQAALGARHLVMGHTPHFSGFVARCANASVLLIDTGISRAYGGKQSALVIETHLQGRGRRAHELETVTAHYVGEAPVQLARITRELAL